MTIGRVVAAVLRPVGQLWAVSGLGLGTFLILVAAGASATAADRLRLALFHTELSRNGPGLLLRDIRAGAEDVLRVRDMVVAKRPDVIVLLGFDYDLNAVALAAFQSLVAAGGHELPHHFALRPNRGMATGLDMDGDGRTGTADDAQGYGPFSGAAGMAVLSRLPIDERAMQDHSAFLWRDLPDAMLPVRDGLPYPSAAVFDVQRLATTGFWGVPVILPDGGHLTLFTWHAGPPVFGGPHERNRRRNHDEAMFWVRLLEGDLPFQPPASPFVLLGNSNLDPDTGDGLRAAMRALLALPVLQDPLPEGIAATQPDARDHATAHFARGPGWLRTSYILPEAGLHVLDSGLVWPPPPARHALVWVDIALP